MANCSVCETVEAVPQIIMAQRTSALCYVHYYLYTRALIAEGEPEKCGTLCVRFLHFLVVVEVEDKFKVFCVLDAFSYYTDRV